MSKTEIRHMSMSIQGFLNNYKYRNCDGIATDDDGNPISGREFKAYLRKCLKKGWRLIPMGNDCEGFDHQNGCPGHPLHGPELPKNLEELYRFDGTPKNI